MWRVYNGIMKGFEQAGTPELWQGSELSGLPIDAPEVQGALALVAYRAAHGGRGINPVAWEQNDAATQSAALNEWVGEVDDKSSFAALYRMYVEKYPHKRIDLGDTEALTEILEALVVARTQLQEHQ